jgi:hypothetical protein
MVVSFRLIAARGYTKSQNLKPIRLNNQSDALRAALMEARYRSRLI